MKSVNLTEQVDQHIDTDTEELFQVKFSYGKANLVASESVSQWFNAVSEAICIWYLYV